MTSSTITAPPPTTSGPSARQKAKARQLLMSSAKQSYDPEIDIDWGAPLVEGKWFLPEHRCSLYGTSLWEGLDIEQRMALSREEMASSIALGVWTEHMLLQLVARYVYDRDVATPEVQFALTEVADEVRHMLMFANVVSSIGASTYLAPRMIRESGRLMKSTFPVEVLWALVLLTEELFDRVQREMAADESVQPVIRAMCRIHVVEEARHISFARAELDTFVHRLNPVQRGAMRTVLALSAQTFTRELFNPEMYRRAGLDPAVAVRAARSNPNNRRMFAWAGERIVRHYQQIGLVGGASERIWRSAGFL